jgi:hypothetical protein
LKPTNVIDFLNQSVYADLVLVMALVVIPIRGERVRFVNDQERKFGLPGLMGDHLKRTIYERAHFADISAAANSRTKFEQRGCTLHVPRKRIRYAFRRCSFSSTYVSVENNQWVPVGNRIEESDTLPVNFTAPRLKGVAINQ